MAFHKRGVAFRKSAAIRKNLLDGIAGIRTIESHLQLVIGSADRLGLEEVAIRLRGPTMRGAELKRSWATWTGYDVVRIALGLLLLTAAALKGHQLATEPTAETSLLTSRWLLIAVVEFELFFGLWLLAGLYPRWTWRGALLCFGAFGSVSLWKAISGEASCGCFGRVPISPWQTLVVDGAIVMLLLHWGPERDESVFKQSSRSANRRAVGVVGVSIAVGIPAALVMAAYRPAAITPQGAIAGQSQFVVLKPAEWIGNRFPLIDWVDIGGQLARGEWIVLLYHVGCPECREMIAEYGQLGHDPHKASDARRVALIQAPHSGSRFTGDVDVSSCPGCVSGQLSDSRRWFVSTPAVVFLEDGVVSSGFCEAENDRLSVASREVGPWRRQRKEEWHWAGGSPARDRSSSWFDGDSQRRSRCPAAIGFVVVTLYLGSMS